MASYARVIKIVPERTAFFVCDIQDRMRGAVSNYDSVIKTAARMVRVAELFKVPVVITEQVPKVFQGTVPEVMDRFSTLPESQRFGPYPKTKFGMIIPEVETILSQKDIQSVVLFGVESHICIVQTAMALLAGGKDVHALADGVSSINAEEVPIALARMRQAGASVTTSESLVYEMMGDAGDSSKFKPFAAVMKEEKSNISESLKSLLGNAGTSV
ncbi:hypothetical protein M407DRAFT_156555 [Tulasnella calospora MUT 4182]|uniref:Isochorismatase-like domain-containing protein n=1 Tax=Tulasnella calospora MUT 4182 TaxID=1051891 RepID=A0A0C3QFI6_9AGAM|nr:hypothetical protein M407DRAFT_156555 [Tulasnella calospora MUT 4182]